MGEAFRTAGQRLSERFARFRRLADVPLRIAERPLRFGQRIGRHDVPGLSAELAYRFFLALFPFVIFLAALGAFVARALGIADPSGEILRSFGAALPAEVATLVGDELRRIVERQDAGLLSFGALAALWIATGGTNAIFKALNRAYELRETRPFWRVYAMAIGLTLGGGTLIVIVFIALLGAQVAGADIAARLGLELLWRALLPVRWALAVLVLTLGTATLYRLGTAVRPPWRAALPGGLLFAVAWLGFTFLFAWYVDTVADYGATYGALAGVAGLLAWLYVSAFVLLLGAELTASLFEPTEPPQTAGPPSPS